MGLQGQVRAAGKTSNILDILSPDKRAIADGLIAKGASIENALQQVGVVICTRGVKRCGTRF